MKKYTVKAEYADQIFGSAESSYVDECMQNGMPEEDVMHLVREWGPEVLEQFDIEEEKENVKTWYAAVMDREDNDWGHGSHDLEEAKKMARKLGEESLVIEIADGDDPVAVREIDPWEEDE